MVTLRTFVLKGALINAFTYLGPIYLVATCTNVLLEEIFSLNDKAQAQNRT